jgi:hypothetical protein
MDKVRLSIDIFILAVIIGYAIARIRAGSARMPKFRYLCKIPICLTGLYWIRYLYNTSKRGIQVILFRYVFNLEWRRDVFREMNTRPRWVQSGRDNA